MTAEVGSLREQHTRRDGSITARAAKVAVRDVVAPLRVFAVSRAVVLACALASIELVNHDPGRGPWPRLPGPHVALVQALGRWDAGWYIDVARFGYRPIHRGTTTHASQAFFPGYPVLVRVVARVFGVSALLAAVLLTFVLGAAAAVVLWKLVERLVDADAARRAVTLFCLSPGAFVLSMGYSEALYVLAAAVALWFLVRREWWWAGLATAVAGLTRSNGLALIGACALVAVVALVQDRDWRAFAAPIVGSLGTLGFFGDLYVRSGHLLQWFRVERNGWYDRAAPVSALVHHVKALSIVGLQASGLNDLVWLVSGLVGIACLVALVQWRPPLAVTSFGVLGTLLALSSYQVGLRPRMLLTAFPIVLAVGVRLHGRAYQAALTASVVSLVVLSILSFGTLAVFP